MNNLIKEWIYQSMMKRYRTCTIRFWFCRRHTDQQQCSNAIMVQGRLVLLLVVLLASCMFVAFLVVKPRLFLLLRFSFLVSRRLVVQSLPRILHTGTCSDPPLLAYY